MRLRPALALLLLLLAALALPAALAAQPRPLSGVFRISHPFTPADARETRDLVEPAAAALATGGFAVVWRYVHTMDGAYLEDGIEGRLLSFAGLPVGDLGGVHNTFQPNGPECPALTATAAGGFVEAHLEFLEPNSVVQAGWFGPGPTGLAGDSNVGNATEADHDLCPALAGDANGQSVIAWARVSNNDAFSRSMASYVRAYDPAGQPLGPPLALAPPVPGADETRPAVGMDPAGRFVVVWNAGSTVGLLARRFAADGTPSGAVFPIVTQHAGEPLLAMAPDGGFAVIYSKPAPVGQPLPLVLRRFAADDSPVGTPFSPGAVASDSYSSAASSPKLSTDRYGNFALSWLDAAGHDQVRIFDRALTPRGGFSPTIPAPDASHPAAPAALALTDSGRLLAVWADRAAMRAQLWQALREASFCVYRGDRFLCDAAANGQPTVAFTFGAGLPADVPLLGDVDGDGQVDPCVHHGNRFACDTARNGGAAEVRIDFGLPGDVPLLADVDGDGRADPCVHRGNRFLCDTRHDGVFAEVKIAFGVPGDLALLGDVDGDRRADPCIYRGGVFYCDTAHDGVFAETRLDLRPALGGATDGVPLLGDLDGDGRADACLYRAGTLTCGLFAKAGGAPLQVIARQTFGEPGDVPLLAYVGPR